MNIFVYKYILLTHKFKNSYWLEIKTFNIRKFLMRMQIKILNFIILCDAKCVIFFNDKFKISLRIANFCIIMLMNYHSF